MSDKLDELKGPWRVEHRRFTVDDLRRVLAAMPGRDDRPKVYPEAVAHALGIESRSDRMFDRAMQLLKRVGLVRYHKAEGRAAGWYRETP